MPPPRHPRALRGGLFSRFVAAGPAKASAAAFFDPFRAVGCWWTAFRGFHPRCSTHLRITSVPRCRSFCAAIDAISVVRGGHFSGHSNGSLPTPRIEPLLSALCTHCRTRCVEQRGVSPPATVCRPCGPSAWGLVWKSAAWPPFARHSQHRERTKPHTPPPTGVTDWPAGLAWNSRG